MELVSIIIPVYNVEKYIENCLKSIIKQTYKNLEIILIDDGSNDCSVKIIEKYIGDKRIKLIKQKNKGVSAARNIGIKKAKGKYLMFVDSDDWLDLNCIEKCINFMEKNGLEIVLFSRKDEYEEKTVAKELFLEEFILKEKSTIENIFFRRYFGPYKEELKECLEIEKLNTVWGKIYSKKIITTKFKDIKIVGSEDCIFNLEIFFNVNKIGYVQGIYYHYRKSNMSSITKTYKKNLYVQFRNMYKIMEKYIELKKLPKNYVCALNNRKIINLFSFILNICYSDLKFKNKLQEIKNILNDKFYIELFKKFNFKYLDYKWYIFYKMCQYRMSFMILIIMICAINIKRKVN